MTPAAVQSMKNNEEEFAKLMASFTSGTVAFFFALGHAIYAVGLQKAKNQDGSLDIHVSPTGATAGGLFSFHPTLAWRLSRLHEIVLQHCAAADWWLRAKRSKLHGRFQDHHCQTLRS
jgi:hypothetical protein